MRRKKLSRASPTSARSTTGPPWLKLRFRQLFRDLEDALGAFSPDLIPSTGCYTELQDLAKKLLVNKPDIEAAFGTFQTNLKESFKTLVKTTLATDLVFDKYKKIKYGIDKIAKTDFETKIQQTIADILKLSPDQAEKARDIIEGGVKPVEKTVLEQIGAAKKFITDPGQVNLLKAWVGDPAKIKDFAEAATARATGLATELIQRLNAVGSLAVADVRQEVLGLISSASESAQQAPAPITAPLEHLLRENEANILGLASEKFSEQLRKLSDRSLRLAAPMASRRWPNPSSSSTRRRRRRPSRSWTAWPTSSTRPTRRSRRSPRSSTGPSSPPSRPS